MNERAAAMTCIVSVVLAGCSGIPLPQNNEATGTTDSTTTTTSVVQSTTTIQTTTTTERANVIAYQDLSVEAKRVFDWALENKTIGNITGIDSEDVHSLFVNEYVEYRGTLYSIQADRHLTPRYVLVGLKTVNHSEIENESNVINYSNLNEDGQKDFNNILKNNTSNLSYPPEQYPFPDSPTDDEPLYVYYEGSYYELQSALSDIWVYRFSVSKSS